MDSLNTFAQGFASIANLPVALALLAGAILGIIVGVLPGVGPGVTIAVLLPFTYGMPPLAGLALVFSCTVSAVRAADVVESSESAS